MMNKFGGGATAELPPGGRGGHFPKWPPQPPGDIHMIIFNTYRITYTMYNNHNVNHNRPIYTCSGTLCGLVLSHHC